MPAQSRLPVTATAAMPPAGLTRSAPARCLPDRDIRLSTSLPGDAAPRPGLHTAFPGVLA